MEFAQEGGEGPTPYEVLLHAAMSGDSAPFTRQDSVEETLAHHAAAARAPAAGAQLREGHRGGRRRPTRLVSRVRPLARTVGGVMSRRQEQARDGQVRRTAAAGRRRRRSGRAGRAAERRGAVAVHADRRLRVPVGLPHGRAGGSGRRDRLAVRAALRLAQRVRVAARPRRRVVPARPVRDQRPERPHLRAGHQHAGDGLEDAHRLGDGARCADHGPAPRRGHDHPPYAAAGRRGRRARAGARRCCASTASVEIELVCEPAFDYGRVPGAVVARRRSPPRRRDRRRSDDPAADRHAARDRGQPRPGAAPPAGGRAALLRALVGRGTRASRRRSRRPTRS